MEEKNFLGKIKSKYIFKTIFNYIKGDIIKLKLFKYSKSFQNELDLNLFCYQKKFFEIIGLNIFKYLSIYDKKKEKYPEDFDKDYLNTKLEKDLKYINIDIKIIKEYVVKCFENYNFNNRDNYDNYEDDEDDNNNEIYIDIYSPFFEILSKIKNFEKIFIIPISSILIEKYNLKNDYISIFNNLNSLNINYPFLEFYLKEEKDINYFIDFKINFNLIKKLKIDNRDKSRIISDQNYGNFFKNLFMFKDIENNLVKLDIIIIRKNEGIDPNIIECINNFKVLKYLSLDGFKFKKDTKKTFFTLKLNNLNELSIYNCKKIILVQETCTNLIKLNLDDNSIIIPDLLLKFPNLEEIDLNINLYNQYKKIIDFTSLKKLKKFIGNIDNFLMLKNTLLEDVNIQGIDIENQIQVKMIEKILSIKTLKKAKFELGNMNNLDILKINGNNNSIKELKIYYTYDNRYKKGVDFDINDLLCKFPNITSLSLYADSKSKLTNLEIKQNSKCKINKIILVKPLINNLKLCFESFDNLKEINIDMYNKIKNLKNSFPIFNEKCKIFNSLINFSFEYDKKVNLDIIYNLYNNIENMPNLKKFKFICKSKDITENFYIKFIQKILKLKLNFIEISIVKNEDEENDIEYSFDEIKTLFPEINYFKFENYHIYKLCD